jgi:hypothetical protein
MPSELFFGLESSESGTGGRVRSKVRGNPAGLDRDRVLEEVAVVERAVRTLKETVLTENEGTPPHAPSRGRKRPVRTIG